MVERCSVKIRVCYTDLYANNMEKTARDHLITHENLKMRKDMLEEMIQAHEKWVN